MAATEMFEINVILLFLLRILSNIFHCAALFSNPRRDQMVTKLSELPGHEGLILPERGIRGTQEL